MVGSKSNWARTAFPLVNFLFFLLFFFFTRITAIRSPCGFLATWLSYCSSCQQRGKHACAHPCSSTLTMPPQFETVKVGNHVPVLYQSKTTSPQQSFVNVLITPDGVETSSFLEAADGLMDLFGKFIIPSQQLRLSLNPFPPIKISWAALSLHSSRRI